MHTINIASNKGIVALKRHVVTIIGVASSNHRPIPVVNIDVVLSVMGSIMIQLRDTTEITMLLTSQGEETGEIYAGVWVRLDAEFVSTILG
jgi:hypothetical protein